MLAWSIYASIKKRKDLADIAWGLGFVLIAWTSFILSPFSIKALVVNLLVTLWGGRLSLHIYLRNKGKKEDPRYKDLGSFTKIFAVQGALLYVIALPIIWINMHPYPLNFIATGAFILLYAYGFSLEAISDAQLLSFKKNPKNKGKILKTGLWGYVRHPNYLGEICIWWAVWIMSIPLPFGIFLIMSPLTITFCIIKISGIPPLEEKMKDHPDFKSYAKKVPCLFPSWPFKTSIH